MVCCFAVRRTDVNSSCLLAVRGQQKVDHVWYTFAAWTGCRRLEAMRHITFLAIYAVIKNKKVSLFAWGWKGLKEKWVLLFFFKGVEKCWWKWWSWVGLLSCSMLCLAPFVIEASRYTQGWGWGVECTLTTYVLQGIRWAVNKPQGHRQLRTMSWNE